MTEPTEPQQPDETLDDTNYYAVNAARVMLVFEAFQMRPSHFSARGKSGAQSVYYNARKIINNRTSNQWGHHTARAIKNFCYFTQSENQSLLPWQELIEHSGYYDGIEGAGRRTGNRLKTKNHLHLRHEAMRYTRQQCKLSQQQLAKETALPLRFIKLMEAGSWPIVAQTTLNLLSDTLNVEQSKLYTPIPEITPVDSRNTADKTSDTVNSGSLDSANSSPPIEPAAPVQPTHHKPHYRTWLLILPVFGLFFWAGHQFYPSGQQNAAPLTDSERPPDNAQLQTLSGCWNWSNNSYITINPDGTAHNGIFGATWRIIDADKRLHIITWPSFVDTLSLSAEGDTLSGHNNFNIPINATRKSGSASDFTGPWLWGNGITAEIRADASIIAGSLRGTWHKAGGKLIIEWPLVDTVTLSANGLGLKIHNQFGASTATRDINCKAKQTH